MLKEDYIPPGQAPPTNRETMRQEVAKAAKEAAAKIKEEEAKQEAAEAAEEAAAEYQFSDEYQAAAEAEEKAAKIKEEETKQETTEAAEEAAAHQSSATPGPSNMCSLPVDPVRMTLTRLKRSC